MWRHFNLADVKMEAHFKQEAAEAIY